MPNPQQFEVEAKTLLGEEAHARAFEARLREADPELQEIARSSQLNHYFQANHQGRHLFHQVVDLIAPEDQGALSEMLTMYSEFSLRTRKENNVISLVIKAAKTGEDKDHALARAEGQYVVATNDLLELDNAILSAGYTYLSKWSRDRVEYRYKNYTVTIDKNAGYGYLAEIEKVVANEAEAESAKAAILQELAHLGYEELPQDRLGRMFAFYNEHWPEYYQTDKTFNVE